KLTNVSLNILTLPPLTLPIPRLIHDSILLLHNIFTTLSHPNQNLKRQNLIITATTRLFKPIISSTLLTILLFLPLLFLSPSLAQIFTPFPLPITFTLLPSLLLSITLLPSLPPTFFK
ncbi:efflux RND transporter permease subunit, partial [Staphylococcus epidermidis]|uniref:efflux RND transporter permease subunit n=1 Tax=Staphylococcus epidermidis TaxID=1282 RepID=UPI0011A0EB39